MLLLPDGEGVPVNQWTPHCHQHPQLSSQLRDSQLLGHVKSFRGHFPEVPLKATVQKQATLEAGRLHAVWPWADLRGEGLD